MTDAPADVKAKKEQRELIVTWSSGRESRYHFRDLRLACRCAGCVDEFTGRPILDPSTVTADIAIDTMSLVGSYALKIVWSDGHDTGLYTWDRLRQLG